MKPALQGRKKLSLTFDNGPTPGITDLVLDTLDRFGVKASFFLVGEQLGSPEARALAERAFQAGHRIGNHSFSHGVPLGLQEEPGAAAREILAAHEALGGLVGDHPLYRPNGRGKKGRHLLSVEAVETLESIGASVVLWTSVPRDRAAVVDRPDLWVEDAKRAVEESDWTLMCLHDRPSGFPAPGPMAYLGDFLTWAMPRVEFRQDFPETCVPLERGRPRSNLSQYVTA
ncbi:MAG: polysaccharide deacetylase family protein [Pseudomonadota bacterium]